MKKHNWLLYLSLIIILIYSVLNIYNAQLLDYSYKWLFIKQIIWIILGFITVFILKFIKNEKIFNMSLYIYLASIILLILVLFLGKEINGAKAWFNFKFLSFQPSEFVKLSLSLFLVSLTSKYNFKKYGEFKYILLVSLLTIIPSVLVFLEPDTGAIIFYLIILFGVLYTSNIKRKWFILFGAFLFILIILFFYLFFNNQDLLIKFIGTSFFYRMDRIINFYSSPGYQIENALITISNTSLWGTGLGKILLYIPEGHTDFGFAFLLGNFGIISGFIILFCYYILDIILIKKSKRIRDIKNKNLFNIFLLLFIFQQLYNILMNINLLPIMGIPLPFLSYGGSTIIIYFVYLGLVLKNN